MSRLLDLTASSAYDDDMVQLSIPLSDELRRYVDGRVAAEGFADPADFLRDLVQRDHDAHEEDVRRVRALYQEGLDSGVLEEEPEDILDEIIADIHGKHG